MSWLAWLLLILLIIGTAEFWLPLLALAIGIWLIVLLWRFKWWLLGVFGLLMLLAGFGSAGRKNYDNADAERKRQDDEAARRRWEEAKRYRERYQERERANQANQAKQARASLYSVLGVAPSASPDEIKHNYRMLVLKYHPDKFKGDKSEAEAMLENINAAYAILKDPAKRAAYDREIRGV